MVSTHPAPRPADDAGIGLVETIASLMITMVVLVAVAGLLVGATRANLMSRADSNATQILTEQIEQIRALDYAAVSLITSDSALAADPDAAGGTYDGKPLVVGSSGSVQHTLPTTRNNVSYTTRRYVTTDPADTAGDYKIVTLVTTWQVGEATKTKTVQTMVSETSAGLGTSPGPGPSPGSGPSPTPPPVAVSQAEVGPVDARYEFGNGTRAQVELWLRNSGTSDTWNVTANSSGWTFVRDTNGNGQLDAGEDVLANRLKDTDGNTTVDTGPLTDGQTVRLLAYRDLTSADTAPLTPAFTFTSSAHPADGAKSVSATITITTDSGGFPVASYCTAGKCTPTVYHLDQERDGDQNSTNPNVLWEGETEKQAAGFNYSKEYGPLQRPGRILTTLLGPKAEQHEAVFKFAVPYNQTREYAGTARLELACTGGTASLTAITVELDGVSPNGHVSPITKTTELVLCDGRMRYVDIRLNKFDVSNGNGNGNGNKQGALLVTLSSTSTIRLLYDTNETPSRLTMPRTR